MKYIHILYHTLDLVSEKKSKFTGKQSYILPTLQCQYHAF